jgi:hypothetical protein
MILFIIFKYESVPLRLDFVDSKSILILKKINSQFASRTQRLRRALPPKSSLARMPGRIQPIQVMSDYHQSHHPRRMMSGIHCREVKVCTMVDV